MTQAVRLSSIVAMAQNRVIGKDGALPWHIPEDLKWFKAHTRGKPLVMGRKCFESLKAEYGGPLPNRYHVVISRNALERVAKKLPVSTLPSDTFIIPAVSVEDGIFRAKQLARTLPVPVDEVFIIGGGEIYAQTMDQIDRLYLTIINKDYEGDTYFPEIDWKQWRVVSEDKREGFTFFVLEPKAPVQSLETA